MDTQQPYPANGNTAALSLMPNLALLPGQFGTPGLAEIPPNEPNKIDPPAWGMPDAVQDKQHQVKFFPDSGKISSILYLKFISKDSIMLQEIMCTTC